MYAIDLGVTSRKLIRVATFDFLLAGLCAVLRLFGAGGLPLLASSSFTEVGDVNTCL
jgi:hypothetical protein